MENNKNDELRWNNKRLLSTKRIVNVFIMQYVICCVYCVV